ncbi:protein SYM1-like [Cynara cardunculus var. scolymus]|uniref:Mpv17/PMP22 n=1 Tax=Cynara cardunculus var. scolymus TaxID=59895 RepID=A0A103Y3L9_CYNCS|nr:protein SYM1-like [Cynara cardunculus var. scolymus]KVI01909.1 Mpv17/PMP22 [Cynara cardunculus var. scolymus]
MLFPLPQTIRSRLLLPPNFWKPSFTNQHFSIKMNASVLRIGNKAHYHIWMRHSLSDSLGVQQHLQHSNAFYSRFPGRRATEMGFSVPVRALTTKTNGRTMSSSITNSGFVGWYLGMIKTRPILTKSITSALIYTAADLTSQTMSRLSSSSEGGYDVIRICRMAGYGLIILGPTLHLWFNFVSRVLPKQDLMATFKKMLMGQTIFGPIMTAVFFSVNAALQGESGEEIVARLNRDMVPTMINNVLYWPICDFITFRFVPVHLQPLVSNSFSYVWTIYITYMANLSKAAAANS